VIWFAGGSFAKGLIHAAQRGETEYHLAGAKLYPESCSGPSWFLVTALSAGRLKFTWV